MASSEFSLQGTRMVSAKLSSATAPRAPWSIHLLLTLIVALVATFARPALPNTPEDGSAVQRPRDAESGRLFFRNDDQSTTPAPLLLTDVRIAVSGMVARSVVKQQFHNTGAGWVEGVYVFPLPKDSAVDRLRLTIGERVITGTIEERQQAQRAYQQARAQGQRAGLVEQERPNIFTTSVANVGPGEKVTVEIEYQESLRYDQGRFALRFPLVVGPRYIPGEAVRVASTGWAPITTEVPDAHRITPPVRHPSEGLANPVSIQVEIDAGLKLAAVESGTHPIRTGTDANGRVTVALAEERVPADRDFVLSWRPEPGAAPTAGLFTEMRDGRTHLLVMLMPPTADSAPSVPPREMIFIIDTSGSMEGTSIRQAKAALHLGLDRLKPHDTFNIIQFNSTASVLFGGPQAATRDSLRMAHDYVESLRATGGTEMMSALNLALNRSETPGRVRQLVFLTDGAVGNEDALFRRIQERLGDSRLFTIGIGSAPNSWFMSRAAQAGRGTFTHIDKLGEVTQRMAALFEKLEKPVLTDVVVTWPDGVDVETYPAPIPDLYAGEPVVFVGRSTAALPADAAIRISGRSAGQVWTRELALAGRDDRSGVAAVWARRKLAALEDSRLEGTSPTQVREDSLKLAVAYQLISRYTSLIAIDPMPVRPRNEPVDTRQVPTNLPDGWTYEAVFGSQHASAPGASKHAYAAGAAVQRMAAAPAPAMADQSMMNTVTLPQTATAAELKILFGLLSMLAAILLLVWQYRSGGRRA
jgi:Ca-activated chloride channel family protein